MKRLIPAIGLALFMAAPLVVGPPSSPAETQHRHHLGR